MAPNTPPAQMRPAPDLNALSRLLSAQPAQHRPLESWNPPDCGRMDLTIKADGTWLYAGSPITRAPLVNLFASVLWREEDRYFLKTPVEKIEITVEDLPLFAVELQVVTEQGDTQLVFRTSTEDVVIAGPDHALVMTQRTDGQALPALHIRRGLYARVTRSVYYQLVAQGETQMDDGILWFGLRSKGCFFPMIEADALD